MGWDKDKHSKDKIFCREGSSEAWLDEVNSLRCVSEKIFASDPKISYKLLGEAMENVIKFHLIIAGGNAIEEKNNNFSLSKLFRSHNLDKLADKIDCQLTDKEIRLLNILSKFIKWGGRYPIPLLANDMCIKHTSIKEYCQMKKLFSKLYDSYFKKLKTTYKVKSKK